ncbi:MAG: NAD(P)H-dependent oxidoreductase [Pseudochelatococcus sp.]|jgi:NAD(P)H dehydrogenase (quinone)|uniref:NAD(P)H-dependent oxidoreductase n=1 Tax=Pseudochelatococcus sp. TaxID=2020869 RepID=UPI003D90C923
MHALIVISHPRKDSFTHALATEVAQGVADAGQTHTVEIADLAAEGFNPSFSAQDHAYLKGEAELPADVIAEQERLERADAVVLVYPIYWWSFPALLKGWIDRVFTLDWAYGSGNDGKPVKRLGRFRFHLVGVGDSDIRTYARHGYWGAMKTQIDHGIFDYCGATVVTSEVLPTSEPGFPAGHLETARRIGRKLFASP